MRPDVDIDDGMLWVDPIAEREHARWMERRSERRAHPVRWHDWPGDQRLGSILMAVSLVAMVIIALAALAYSIVQSTRIAS